MSYTEAANLGTVAEAQGFDGIFAVEGGLNNDVMATVQTIASATSRATVGTGIANLYLRHPALLGAGAVAIDEISGGRLILGIGVNNARAVRALGIAWREPCEALRDTTAWLRRVFAGEAPEGIRATLRPARRPIPIHLAGIALETADLAGEIADGLMLYLASKLHFQELVDRMEGGATRAGRRPQDITVSLLIPMFLSEDLGAAREAARRFLTLYAAMPHYARMFRRSGFCAGGGCRRRGARSRRPGKNRGRHFGPPHGRGVPRRSPLPISGKTGSVPGSRTDVSDSGATSRAAGKACHRDTTFPHDFSCQLIPDVRRSLSRPTRPFRLASHLPGRDPSLRL